MSGRKQGDCPVGDDADPVAPARGDHQVIGAPDPPGDKAAQADSHDAAKASVVAQRAHDAECAVNEWLRRLTANGGVDITRQMAALSHRMLSKVGIMSSIGRRDGRTIPEGPESGMLLTAHGRINCDLAVLAFF